MVDVEVEFLSKLRIGGNEVGSYFLPVILHCQENRLDSTSMLKKFNCKIRNVACFTRK